MSIIKAVFYSPLAAVTIVLFFVAIISGSTIIHNSAIYSLSMIALVVYLIGLLGTILLGIPTYLILNKLHIRQGITYVLIGFISPIFLLWLTMFYGSKQYDFLAVVGIVSGCCGALCSYVVWLYAVYKAPDDDLLKNIE